MQDKPLSVHQAVSTSGVASPAPRSSSRATRRSAQPRRLLADVLWEAANKWLATGPTKFLEAPLEYSCNAAIMAEFGGERRAIREVHTKRRRSRVVDFLCGLGCNLDDQNPGMTQGVRYMWLLLAACVAEDEGIEI